MLAAEAAYCQMEAELQEKLDNYEAEHDYDEYHFELDELGHDPYVLISLISSLHDGPWTVEDVRPTLELIFAQQYILTEEIIKEIREETTDPTEPTPTDPEPTQPPSPPRPPGPTPQPQSQHNKNGETETSVYKICNVTLDNFNLSHVPVYMLNESQLARYSVYMKCLGFRPDLFPESEYVNLYNGGYTDYAIPTEALEDEVFAAMMTEARKYLGYPYVWGGSSPSTSFDCSGYVSWVINHTIVNGSPYWGNIGRRGASALYDYCTPTSTPHPGDLVFFENTYQATPQPRCSHVGIYVGVNPETGHPMMIHCGDPISFADLSSSYWQAHFYAYGRLPNP
jgi:cell wall-associated NlpC family hydrolase